MIIYFKPFSGLGDKLLDLIGFLVYCKYGNHIPVIDWCSDLKEKHPWGSGVFCKSLFDWNLQFQEFDEQADKVISKSTGASLCIYNIKNLIVAENKIEISSQEVAKAYCEMAREVLKPSSRVAIPEDIHKCIGIHLRRSDKIKEVGQGDMRHETNIVEYVDIIDSLKRHLAKYIQFSLDQTFYFFVCSEDRAYRTGFCEWLEETCSAFNKKFCIIEPTYGDEPGAAAVSDFFCLSRCKRIYQGIKYSTFSTMAAVVGNVPLYNFAHHSDASLIHIWKPCLIFINPPCYDAYTSEDHKMHQILSHMHPPITPFTSESPLVYHYSWLCRFLPKR